MTVTDIHFPTQCWESYTAKVETRWGRSGAMIAITGEIDAANADQIAAFVQHCTRRCEWLVLDLSGLEFIGTAGFSALRAIEKRCADAALPWALVPGTAVSRLLRLCDPEGQLPTMKTTSVALAQVQDSLAAVDRPVA